LKSTALDSPLYCNLSSVFSYLNHLIVPGVKTSKEGMSVLCVPLHQVACSITAAVIFTCSSLSAMQAQVLWEGC
jgi:hypothetical protein